MALLPLTGVAVGIAVGLLLSVKRFTIRTALIATTLVAMALGLAASLL